jgi:hypothetical protein
MKSFIVTVVVLIPLPNLLADDPDQTALRSIGATLKETDGVITSLQIDCTKLTDADFRLIGTVKTLKSLSISGKPMSDKHLELRAALPEVTINWEPLTDEGKETLGKKLKL